METKYWRRYGFDNINIENIKAMELISNLAVSCLIEMIFFIQDVFQKPPSEFLKFSQNSQENTCARVSFW